MPKFHVKINSYSTWKACKLSCSYMKLVKIYYATQLKKFLWNFWLEIIRTEISVWRGGYEQGLKNRRLEEKDLNVRVVS